MDRYLDRKNVKFEDERLNCAIDVVALAKNGSEKMDFLIDNLTVEAIEIINSKQNVNCIPLKNGYTMECLLDDYMDSSFNKSIFFISLIKDDISYDYCFNLYYFHDKCYSTNIICLYNETKKVFDKYGECVSQEPIDGKDIEFTLVDKEKSNIFEFQGMRTVYNGNKTSKVYFNAEKLLSAFRNNLKSRGYYNLNDKEIYRLYYPNKYEFYTTDKTQIKAADYSDLICEIFDLVFMMKHCVDRFEYDRLLDEYKFVCKQVEKVDIGDISNNFFSYEEWCGYYDLDEYTPISYETWKKNKIVKNSNETSFLGALPNSSRNKYSSYNPYKNRYDDEEEEVIVKNIRK